MPLPIRQMRSRELVDANNAYEILVQSVVDYGIYMMDPEGHVASWNTGAERIKGYTADEIIGENFSRFYTEEDRAAGVPERALRTAAETGRFSAEGWRVRKDGRRFWAMVVIDAIYRNGELIGFAKITRDMTERREAERARLEAERRFRLLVQGVVDYAIFMLDPTGHVTNWNAGAERIKGYREEEVLGKHFSTFYTEEDRAAGLPDRALNAAREKGCFEAEGWRVRKDGSRFWAGVVIDAIYEAGVLIGFAKVTRDLTERREAELELEQSRELLFQAQKMEAVGQLTGGLAHDLNNLLAGITGSLELLRIRVAQRRLEEVERYVSAALANAGRAASITHRLLAFARKSTLDAKPTKPNDLITGMTELIQGTIGPAIVFKTDLAPDAWPTLCDQNQLESALLNLCINARDAMPEGGQITIKTGRCELGPRETRPIDLEPGDYLLIAVKDTGTGMSEEVARRAFDPFFTTKPLGQGTGLGLSMVYGFVRQSGGHARIVSKQGEGTTVMLFLKRYHGAVEAEQGQASSAQAPHAASGETVLIVDDEDTVRMLIGEVLEDMGYTVLQAGDGPSALTLLQSGQKLDLLVSDIGLPGAMNGRQLAETVRQTRPGLKVLFITGYAESAGVDSALEPGTQLLTKPFALDTLAERIKDVLAS